MISTKEEPGSSVPPAVDGLLGVHKRIIDDLESDFTHAPSGVAGKVSIKLLVPASQAGSLIGKQGGTVKSIQEASNCIVRVLGAGKVELYALCTTAVIEHNLDMLLSHWHNNSENRLAGKRKMYDPDDNLECSWPLLAETLDEEDSDETSYSSSDSETYSGRLVVGPS